MTALVAVAVGESLWSGSLSVVVLVSVLLLNNCMFVTGSPHMVVCVWCCHSSAHYLRHAMQRYVLSS